MSGRPRLRLGSIVIGVLALALAVAVIGGGAAWLVGRGIVAGIPGATMPPASGTASSGTGTPSTVVATSASPGASSSAGTDGAAVLVGAGDIAECQSDADSRTAALVEAIPGTVFAAGDIAYQRGSDGDFRDCYGPTWGRFQDRTLPAAGNHEYMTKDAAGYFAEFGAAAGTPGEGWYATTVGTWRVIVLNANCAEVGGCGAGSPQLAWLQAELAARPTACTVAIWHQPRWSSGLHGNDRAVAPFWTALYAAGAELVLNGHDHDYERFAPQDPSGALDPARGIREFVVGTGGAALRGFVRAAPNREAADARTHGVLKLTLRSGGYDWQFVPVEGETYSDAGSATCH